MVGLAGQTAVQRLLHVVGPFLCEVPTGGAPQPAERVIRGLIPLSPLEVSNVFGHRLEVLDLLDVPEQ